MSPVITNIIYIIINCFTAILSEIALHLFRDFLSALHSFPSSSYGQTAKCSGEFSASGGVPRKAPARNAEKAVPGSVLSGEYLLAHQ